jgi:hypothetical protein
VLTYLGRRQSLGEEHDLINVSQELRARGRRRAVHVLEPPRADAEVLGGDRERAAGAAGVGLAELASDVVDLRDAVVRRGHVRPLVGGHARSPEPAPARATGSYITGSWPR